MIRRPPGTTRSATLFHYPPRFLAPLPRGGVYPCGSIHNAVEIEYRGIDFLDAQPGIVTIGPFRVVHRPCLLFSVGRTGDSHSGAQPACALRPPLSAAATSRFTAMKLSGLTDIESIPHATRNAAKAGWSLGAWPHRPTLAPERCAASITVLIIHLTASSCSSNSSASSSESRSTPSVSWVRSFEPIEKPSNRSANAFASTTLDGISHMT